MQGCLSYLSLYEAHLVHGQLWHATLRAHTDGAYHGGMLLDDMGRDDAALPVLSCVCVMLSGPDCTAEQKKRAGEVLDGVILGKHGDIFNDAVSASQVRGPLVPMSSVVPDLPSSQCLFFSARAGFGMRAALRGRRLLDARPGARQRGSCAQSTARRDRLG